MNRNLKKKQVLTRYQKAACQLAYLSPFNLLFSILFDTKKF